MPNPAEMIREYLNDPKRRHLIKVQAIEKEAGIPASILTMFLTGKRPLPDKHVPALTEVAKRLGYNPERGRDMSEHEA